MCRVCFPCVCRQCGLLHCQRQPPPCLVINISVINKKKNEFVEFMVGWIPVCYASK